MVEPGVITGDLQQAVLKKGLFYPPDPASLENCSLGGNAAAAAGGPRAVKYGTTKDYVLGLEFVTPEGKIMKSGGKYVKNSTGYNLAPLIIGSEGTLAVITKLYLRLIPAPRHTFDFLIPFTNIETAIETVFLIIQKKIIPSTIEFMEANTIELVARYKNEAIPFPNAGAHLLVQLDGNSEHEIQLQYKEILNIKNINQQNVITAKTEEERAKIWSIRRSIRDSIEKESPIFFAEDCAVPVSRIPDFVKGVRERLNKIGIHCLIFGHAGDGNVHINILKKNIENSLWKKIKPQARQLIYELAVQNEGTISGEHGIGCLRKDYLHLTFSESEIKLMKEIKKTFDPNNILNPGKIFDI